MFDIRREGQEILPYIYLVSNASLKLCFQLKEMNPAMKIIEQVAQYVPKDLVAPKSDLVQFKYFAGKTYFYFHQFIEAEDLLGSAFDLCLASKFKNRR